MSLVHDKVTVIPDDPAFDVGGDEWNAEHKFPGAGAGEVVFVDGSGHAATSADFTFDAGSKVLTVGVASTGNIYTNFIGGFDVAGTGGFTVYADPLVGSVKLDLVQGADDTGNSASLVAGNNGSMSIDPSGFNIFCDVFSMNGSPGITDTITAASLAGKTITITKGIITGFA